MKLLTKRTNAAPNQQGTAEPVKITAANWTRGQQLTTTAVRAVLWVLVACAPIGLLVGAVALATAARPLPPAAAADQSEPAGRLEATGIAEHAVITWLGASRGDEAQIEGFLPHTDLPSNALDVSNPGAVSSEFDGTAWVVTVGVTVTSTIAATDDASKPQTITQRRYFQIPITVDPDGQAQVMTLPAEVPGPTMAPAPATDYRATLPPTHPAAAAAGEFLTALLVGGGDITRYTAPGSQIRAVTPAPYTQVALEGVTADTVPDETPDDGDTVVVLARARATDATDAVTRFDYVLELTARASRWEITQIKGAPAVVKEAPPPNMTSPVPAPTTTP